MTINRRAVLLLSALFWSPLAGADDVFGTASTAPASDPIEQMIGQLVGGVCGDSPSCREALSQADSEDSSRRSAYLRQLGAYYVVTAFAQLGAARIPEATPDKDGRTDLATGLLRRIFDAREALRKDFAANAESGVKRAAAYDLTRADAIFYVADVVAAGTRPSVTRLVSLVGNPVSVRSQAGHLIRDALRDAVFGESYRRSFRAVVEQCSHTDGDQFSRCFDEGWKTVGARLSAWCSTLTDDLHGSTPKACSSLADSP